MHKVASILLVCIAQVVLGQQVAQRAVIFESRAQQGEYIIVPQTYVPDLAQYNFDNRARSLCVTGVWVLYVNRNYNIGSNSGVEYFFGPDNFCTDIQTVGGFVSSVRFVGSPNDYRSDTFTLFQDDHFQGEEEYTFTDLPNLNLNGNHKSIVITGRSGWTVFDQPNYGGNSICLFPEPSSNYAPYFIPDVSRVSIPHNTIQSVRKGCIGQLDAEGQGFGGSDIE